MEIREEIVALLADKAAKMFHRDKSEFGPGTRFDDDLATKSVQFVQFTAALEDEYEIEVPFMEFRRKATFAEAADYVAELRGE
jgi:acyl carrier protein